VERENEVKSKIYGKELKKICGRINQDFKCQKVFGCGQACPLWIFDETLLLAKAKNLPLGEAYRLTIRQAIDENTARNILIQNIFGVDMATLKESLETTGDLPKESLEYIAQVKTLDPVDLEKKDEQRKRDRDKRTDPA